MTVHVYVAPGFEEVELITIVDVLRRAEIDTLMVSLTAGTQIHGAHGIAVHADEPFQNVTGHAPEMIILPGGGPGTQAMLAHSELHRRLHAQIAAGQRVAAICAAPMVLAKISLLQGKQATCFPGCESVLQEHGAQISAFNVVNDGLITTSRGPATAALFALELAAQLNGEASAKQVGRAMLYL
ncbi:DJ-1 family glyoxalase III [Chitinibacter sp. GC72]|uniref:DJ-1 family glyoxalase III n=1 Tax=Chitinibacter sp. GC72 TaxID=1526917 RepID=UPI0018DF36B6|nr:DJ-1 family glyoxalase III [Chitinibacter sp. GC72]